MGDFVMKRSIVLIGLSIAMVSCGSQNDASSSPAGRGMARQDLSKVPTRDLQRLGGIKPDASVIRTRRIVGRWSGSIGADKVNLMFGTDGTATIEALRADGAMISGGAGRYSWQKDDTLGGTFSGLTAPISGLSTWTASFPTTSSVAVAGSGVTVLLKKGGM